MQITVKQYETLVKFVNIVYNHNDVFNDEEIKFMELVDDVLIEINDKHVISNKKTAEYIAKRRIEDKNYARSKNTVRGRE